MERCAGVSCDNSGNKIEVTLHVDTEAKVRLSGGYYLHWLMSHISFAGMLASELHLCSAQLHASQLATSFYSAPHSLNSKRVN